MNFEEKIEEEKKKLSSGFKVNIDLLDIEKTV